jgi:hypothetical protein
MEYKSIADAIAAAEKKRAEKAASEAATKKSQAARFGSGRSMGSTSGGRISPADAIDLRDDFDFAIESVDIARKSAAGDPAAVETTAVSLLMTKRQITRGKAVDLVKRAIDYLES